jgi:hypothetical protein
MARTVPNIIKTGQGHSGRSTRSCPKENCVKSKTAKQAGKGRGAYRGTTRIHYTMGRRIFAARKDSALWPLVLQINPSSRKSAAQGNYRFVFNILQMWCRECAVTLPTVHSVALHTDCPSRPFTFTCRKVSPRMSKCNSTYAPNKSTAMWDVPDCT